MFVALMPSEVHSPLLSPQVCKLLKNGRSLRKEKRTGWLVSVDHRQVPRFLPKAVLLGTSAWVGRIHLSVRALGSYPEVGYQHIWLTVRNRPQESFR
jgi:hypothetical protein